MRKPFSTQTRFDRQTIPEVKLNLNCRDEIVPILYGLQHVYSQPRLRDEILNLVSKMSMSTLGTIVDESAH